MLEIGFDNFILVQISNLLKWKRGNRTGIDCTYIILDYFFKWFKKSLFYSIYICKYLQVSFEMNSAKMSAKFREYHRNTQKICKYVSLKHFYCILLCCSTFYHMHHIISNRKELFQEDIDEYFLEICSDISRCENVAKAFREYHRNTQKFPNMCH